MNNEHFTYKPIEIQGEKFYEIDLRYRPLKNLFRDELPFSHSRERKIFEFYRPKLILPFKIHDFAKNGITNDIKNLLLESYTDQTQRLYIDNDRVGLRIGW